MVYRRPSRKYRKVKRLQDDLTRAYKAGQFGRGRGARENFRATLRTKKKALIARLNKKWRGDGDTGPETSSS